VWTIAADPYLSVVSGKDACTTKDGRTIKKDIHLDLPRGVVYVSNKGVGIGATVEAVIAAHGVPIRVGKINKPGSVAALEYCGIEFQFLSGRVDQIRVMTERDQCGK
jgi:hypothetical protein